MTMTMTESGCVLENSFLVCVKKKRSIFHSLRWDTVDRRPIWMHTYKFDNCLWLVITVLVVCIGCTPSSTFSAGIEENCNQINRICVQSDFFHFCHFSFVRYATDIVVLQIPLKFTCLITSREHSDTGINWIKKKKKTHTQSQTIAAVKVRQNTIGFFDEVMNKRCSGCRGDSDRIFVCRSPETRIIWCVIELVDWKIEMLAISTETITPALALVGQLHLWNASNAEFSVFSTFWR